MSLRCVCFTCQQVVASSADIDRNAAAATDVLECACSSSNIHRIGVNGGIEIDKTSPTTSVRRVQRRILGSMDTLRVFVIARASCRLPATGASHAVDTAAASSSAASAATLSTADASEVLKRVCDGLMRALQPLTSLLVEVIPMRMPVEVLDCRCFLQQAS